MQYKNSKSRSPSSSTFVECYKKQQVHYNDKLQMWLLFLLSWPEIWSIHNDKKCSPIMTFTVTSLIEVLAPLKDLFSLIEKKKKVWTKKKCKEEKKPVASVTGGCILMGFISLGRESFGVSSHAMGLSVFWDRFYAKLSRPFMISPFFSTLGMRLSERGLKTSDLQF